MTCPRCRRDDCERTKNFHQCDSDLSALAHLRCAELTGMRVAALEAENAALRETLGKVRSLVETLSSYPADAHCGTCGQPDTDIAGGLMAVRRWQDANNWHGCGNAWHQSQDLRRTSRIRTALITALDGGKP